MYPLTVAMAIESPELWEQVHAAIQDLPVRITVECRDLGGPEVLLQQLERSPAAVVLLDIAAASDAFDQLVPKLRAVLPDSMLVALHTAAEASTILAAFRAGVNEFICPPLAESLRRALEWKSNDQRRSQPGSRCGARTLGFFSAKGGCGATTIACHAAVELGHLGHKVLLADFDLEAGMVAFLTRAKSPYSVLDAINNVHRLDESYWKALVSNGIPNVEVVSAPVAVAARQYPRHEQVSHVLSFMRIHYDWTVVDLGRSLNSMTMHALEEIDEACLVTTAEIPALHQAKQIVSTLADSGFTRLRLVLNRVPGRLEIAPEDLEKMIGTPVYSMIPNNYPELSRCYSEGKLLPRSSRLGKQFGDLARKLSGAAADPPPRRRLFALFG